MNNLHSFIPEEAQQVDHVNSKMVKVCGRLDKLDSDVQKLQSALSLIAIAAPPYPLLHLSTPVPRLKSELACMASYVILF